MTPRNKTFFHVCLGNPSFACEPHPELTPQCVRPQYDTECHPRGQCLCLGEKFLNFYLSLPKLVRANLVDNLGRQ